MTEEFVVKPRKVSLSAVDESNAKELVVGRDELVKNFWDSLERSSVQVVAERRMGKTWFLKRAFVERPDNVVAVYLDVEGFASPVEFVSEANLAR